MSTTSVSLPSPADVEALRRDLDSDFNWRAFALCKHSSVDLFPPDGPGVEIAKAVCAMCPVREDCLEHALVTLEDHGVWGGTSERERRKMRRDRRLKIV